MTRPGKISAQAGFKPGIFRSQGGRLNHLANEAVIEREPRLVIVPFKSQCVFDIEHRGKHADNMSKAKICLFDPCLFNPFAFVFFA